MQTYRVTTKCDSYLFMFCFFVFFTVVCCTPKRQALASRTEHQEQEAIKSETCSRRRQKGGAVIENKEVREGVCRVRSIFKLQTEFDWSENVSSNGKRNWI